VSVPRSAADLPSRFNHLKQPDVIGPDFHPDTYDPLYPFGHGLSYTDFEVGDLSLSADTVGPGSVVTAEVTVENVGDRAGATAFDCYLTDDRSSRVTPVRELADFTRVHLDPGESTTASFDIHVDEFGVLGADGRRRVEPGGFTVRVADCEATFTVEDRQ
jgi:beta-glucosidase